MFKRALDRDPEHVPVLCSYGLLRLAAHHDADGAEALYRRALAADPGHVASLYNLGSLLEGVRQNFSAAALVYQQVHSSTASCWASLACDGEAARNEVGGEAATSPSLNEPLVPPPPPFPTPFPQVLRLDPLHATTLSNYGGLLHTVRPSPPPRRSIPPCRPHPACAQGPPLAVPAPVLVGARCSR